MVLRPAPHFEPAAVLEIASFDDKLKTRNRLLQILSMKNWWLRILCQSNARRFFCRLYVPSNKSEIKCITYCGFSEGVNTTLVANWTFVLLLFLQICQIISTQSCFSSDKGRGMLMVWLQWDNYEDELSSDHHDEDEENHATTTIRRQQRQQQRCWQLTDKGLGMLVTVHWL